MDELFKNYSIELSDIEREKFSYLLKIFMEKNAHINLSAIREEKDIIEKHFIDSIILNIFVELQGKVADVGTGGGFPLLPLAITNPNVQFIGMDSVAKKLKAVDEFITLLPLTNVKTVTGRAEDIGQNLEYREQFDYVVSRATAFLPTLLEYVIPLLKVGGIFIAYKLDDKEEMKSAKKALTRLGAKFFKIKNYTLANQKRTLILIEKTEKTHIKYPRSVGIPLQKPII